MASRIILHIGQQKSGTTYLQKVLQDCADRLADAGILYPMPHPDRRRRVIESHEWATQGLLGAEYPWVSQRQAARERKTWAWLVREVRHWPGAVLLSAEALSVIRAEAIRRVLDELAVGEVDVVVTARSLGRSLPSLWQQHVRNGRSATFEAYVETLARQRERSADDIETEPGLHLWRAFALGRLVRRWAAVVGPRRVRLVVSSGSPPTALWSRFASAAGIADLAEGLPARLVDEPTHVGLTAPEAVALMSVNKALDQAGWSQGAANRMRQLVITEGFVVRDSRGPKIAVPPSCRDAVATWSRDDLAEFTETKVSAIGDLADLRYDPADETTPPPSPEQVCQANTAALLVVLRHQAKAEPPARPSGRGKTVKRLARGPARFVHGPG